MPPKKTQSQSQRQNVIVNIHQSKPATRKRKRKSKPKPTANPFYPERIIIPQLQVKQQAPLDYNKLIDIIQSAQSIRASSNIPARPSNPLSPPMSQPTPISRRSSSVATEPTPVSRRSSSVAFEEQATAIPNTEPQQVMEQQQQAIEQPVAPIFGETVEKGDGGGGNPLNFDPFQQKQADQFFEKPEPLTKAPSAKTADESSEEEEEVPLVKPPQPKPEPEPEPQRRTIYNLSDFRKDLSTRYPDIQGEISTATTLDEVGRTLKRNLSYADYKKEWLTPQSKARERAFKTFPSLPKPTKGTATDFYAVLGR